ncbi:MAG: hypothetical protein QXG91_03135 [Candidatus Aenigmatarchaeota archaeon]
MKFPYFYFRGYYFPVIPVIISILSKSIKTSALIDSGASISLFHGSIARELGLVLESGKKRIFQAASGRFIGYVHKVNIIIGEEKFPCRIAFSDELITSFNLLGRETIFDKFLVIFNEKNKIVELRRI